MLCLLTNMGQPTDCCSMLVYTISFSRATLATQTPDSSVEILRLTMVPWDLWRDLLGLLWWIMLLGTTVDRRLGPGVRKALKIIKLLDLFQSFKIEWTFQLVLLRHLTFLVRPPSQWQWPILYSFLKASLQLWILCKFYHEIMWNKLEFLS